MNRFKLAFGHFFLGVYMSILALVKGSDVANHVWQEAMESPVERILRERLENIQGAGTND
jgi:hypothetical protein